VVFDGKDAVRWVIEHPLPLFLCIVNKASARLSVYHTLARFHAWSLGEWPDRLAMVPDPVIPGKEGKCISWPGSYDLSLDQPILDFSVNEMLDEAFWRKAREVFEHWIDIENDNLTRVRTRLLSCRVPDRYKTNDKWMTGWITMAFGLPNKEQLEQTTTRLKEPLEWVGEQLLRKGDIEGAAKAALLHRHLFPEAHGGLFFHVQNELNMRLGTNSYVYAGVDCLAEVIQKALKGNGKGPG
jgi:hypothetical protein